MSIKFLLKALGAEVEVKSWFFRLSGYSVDDVENNKKPDNVIITHCSVPPFVKNEFIETQNNYNKKGLSQNRNILRPASFFVWKRKKPRKNLGKMV